MRAQSIFDGFCYWLVSDDYAMAKSGNVYLDVQDSTWLGKKIERSVIDIVYFLTYHWLYNSYPFHQIRVIA